MASMKYFVIDAFTSKLFKGNPAGVCLVDKPIKDADMQKISFENNLSETAFLSEKDDGYDLRWFTPEAEIDLCGHGTLASAYVLMNYIDTKAEALKFNTRSGILTVRRDGNIYKLNFPSRKPSPCPVPNGLEAALGAKIVETHLATHMMAVLESEADLLALNPDFSKLQQIKESYKFIVTAKGEAYDFVSRYFTPHAATSEDPVTGSSHTTLIPFWRERLNKNEMIAAQLSKRGGILYCKDCYDRVEIGGEAVSYLVGNIML